MSIAFIALILILGLWAVMASVFLIWSIVGIIGALRGSEFFPKKSQEKSFCPLTRNQRKRQRRSK